MIKQERIGIGKERDGKEGNKGLKLAAEKLFFENQIVPVWASTKDAATILGITPNALRIRKCRGEIECRYFGRYLRFNVSQLNSLFREQRVSRKENR
jgi:hypothetical protein